MLQYMLPKVTQILLMYSMNKKMLHINFIEGMVDLHNSILDLMI